MTCAEGSTRCWGWWAWHSPVVVAQLPSNASLDRCHGTTSRVLWDGRMTRIYHYVATLEYPYTVGCFHGTAISSGHAGGPTGPYGGQ